MGGEWEGGLGVARARARARVCVCVFCVRMYACERACVWIEGKRDRDKEADRQTDSGRMERGEERREQRRGRKRGVVFFRGPAPLWCGLNCLVVPGGTAECMK